MGLKYIIITHKGGRLSQVNLQLSWVHCLFSYKWSANDFKCFEGWIRTFPATWDLNICKSSEPQGSLCFRAQVFGFWVLWGSSFFSPGLLLAFFLGQSPSTLFLCPHPLDGCCFSLGEGLVHTEGISQPSRLAFTSVLLRENCEVWLGSAEYKSFASTST